MATAEVYRLGWEVGSDRLLLISVGSGNSTGIGANLSPNEMNLLYHASWVPASLLAAAQQEQDVLCRIFGETLEGEPIDSELGDMRGLGLRGSPKLFSYVRYEAELSREGLDWLGLPNVQPAHVQSIDAIEFLGEIQQVGVALAERKVKPKHFAQFIPEELGSQNGRLNRR